jgi:hypothetical protein
MGTTVTTNLGLIKPDIGESIKENLPTFAGWASQNEDNCDVLDSLFRAESASYAPTWTATTANPTLGAGGFIVGNYIRLYPRMVIGYFRLFTGGAGFAVGTGNYLISLPVAVDPDLLTFNQSPGIGKALFQDNSAVATSSNFTALIHTTGTEIFFRSSGGIAWTAATPVVPAQNDRVSGYFMYPTEVS